MSNTPWTPEGYSELAGFDGDWRDSWWNEDFLHLMALRWRLDEAKTLLDVGCGAGHWGQRLASVLTPGATIHGVDLEELFLEKARARAERLGLDHRFEYKIGSAEQLPFEDNSLDVVTCQTVLIHVADAPVAIEEMKRVLKPGGLMVAAEPNNLVCGMVDLCTDPRPSWEELHEIMRLQYVCEEGKFKLGRGDNSVGERLPTYFRTAGLEDVQVYSNDRVPALMPPYTSPEEKQDLEMFDDWHEAGYFMYGGPKDNSHDLFLAGGGNEEDFTRLWATLRKWQLAWLEARRKEKLSGARGYLMYLVSGRK